MASGAVMSRTEENGKTTLMEAGDDQLRMDLGIWQYDKVGEKARCFVQIMEGPGRYVRLFPLNLTGCEGGPLKLLDRKIFAVA